MNLLKKLLSGMLLCTMVLVTAQAQPTDNVVAYYPFSGNADDVSGNGNNTYISGVTLTADRLAKASAAYSFNGIDNFIQLPGNLLDNNSAFCISLWFKTSGVSNYDGQVLIDFRGQYNFCINYYSNNSTYQRLVLFNVVNSSASVSCLSPSNSIQDGIWYHVVANYGNNMMQLYINGILKDTKTQTPPNECSGYVSAIGKDYKINIDRCWFYGTIDEVVVYKRSLTDAEITALYNKQLAQSDLPELYGPISFSYDKGGNRISRNIISLKKKLIMNTRPDSTQNAILDKDSLKYTDLNQMVKIYPNPTKGQLQTELSGFDFTQKSGIYVYGPTGALLLQKSPAKPSDVIDLSAYPMGVYIMRIVIGNKVSEWKIVKE